MIIRRKLFSKEEKQERSKSDITSDVAVGAGMGAVYGLGNNLKKQRDKIEDAAGDRVAEVIRGIGKKGK